MRKIVKQAPVKSFSDFVKRNSPKTWEQMPDNIRSEIRCTMLATEQHYLSGYTERLLDVDDKSTHIDHFKKRDLFPALTFEWDNLIVAEHSNAYGADVKDNNPKHKVKSVNDYLTLIDPVHDDPHGYFSYLANGELIPKEGLSQQEKVKALHTIDCFCLNNEALVNERSALITSIIYLKQAGCDSDEIRTSLSAYNYPSVVDYFCSSDIFECLG